MMKTSLHIQDRARDGRPERLVTSLLGFGMLTAALCCTASVLTNGGWAGSWTQAPSGATQPCAADSRESVAEQRLSLRLRRDWREERSAAMIERMDKCEAGSLGSSPSACLSEIL
jgi:hypothetical protein